MNIWFVARKAILLKIASGRKPLPNLERIDEIGQMPRHSLQGALSEKGLKVFQIRTYLRCESHVPPFTAFKAFIDKIGLARVRGHKMTAVRADVVKISGASQSSCWYIYVTPGAKVK